MPEQFVTVDRWAPIRGLWQAEQDFVTYTGAGDSSDVSAASPTPYGIALSSVWFDGGQVRTHIALASDADSGRILLSFSSTDERYVSAGIGGGKEAYVIEEFDPTVGWRRLADAGNMANLALNHQYPVTVGLVGQKMTLQVDGVKVLEHVLAYPLDREQVGIYASGTNPVRFGPVAISFRALSAFVVMQFTSPFDELFEEVILPVCAEAGIEAYRASDIYRPGVVLQSITQGLTESSVIIAEITPVNPNVFYELGYAHGLRKPVILLAERDTPLPFDVSGYRVIFYENAIGGKTSLETDLRRHLENIFG